MAKRIKILCLNILHGGTYMDNLLAFLRQENADILLLQEVNNAQNTEFDRQYRSISVIQNEFSYRFSHFAPLYNWIHEFGVVPHGNAIFSRFPITYDNIVYYNSPFNDSYIRSNPHDYSLDPCNIEHVSLDIDGKNLDVFNTHGVWGKDGNDNPRRLEMSRVIVENIKKTHSVILGGDFNIRPNTETIRNIEIYLTNVFKDELTSTFNIKRKSKEKTGYATSVVDMFFVSPDIKVISKVCPQVDVSDHLPLVMTVEI